MRRKEITRLLDDWNPIGADGLPEDEYDCLVEKIELWLDEGHEMSEFEFLLESFLGDHFRLDVDPDAITEFTSELFDTVVNDDDFGRQDGPALDDEDE